MTTLLLDDRTRPAVADRQPTVSAPPALTLDTLVSGAWVQLRSRGLAACPACGGRMETCLAPGNDGVVGHCTGCGAELS